MSQPLPAITEDLEPLKDRLRRKRNPKRKPRLHLFVLLKAGQVTSRRDAAAHLAVHRGRLASPLSGRWAGGLVNL